VIVLLAEILPGTPLDRLLDQDVAEGLAILDAAASVAQKRERAMKRPAKHGESGGLSTRTVTGPLSMLRPYFRKGRSP
jgi:hypothetical protein